MTTPTDAPKDTLANSKQVTKTITGMILVNKKGDSIEVSVMTENNGDIKVPEEYTSNFSAFGGRSKKVICAVDADGKLIPQSIANKNELAKKDDPAKKK